MDKKTDVSTAKLEEGRGKQKAARRQFERAGGKMPFPNVCILCHRLEIQFKETLASEQARRQDAKPKASGVCPRAGRRRDGARGSTGLGVSEVTAIKSLTQNPIVR